MRIIAGTLKGRRIEAVPGEGTRPMLDRVRESLFDVLQAQIEGARVLDLFAGTGSLGLEAHSRGAARVRLVESRGDAYAVLKRNCEALGVRGGLELVRGDALDRALWSFESPEGPLAPTLALLDPPYPILQRYAARRALFEAMRELVLERMSAGVLVYHSPARVVAAREFGAGLELEEREYGTSSLWFVRRAAARAADIAAEPERGGRA